MNMMPLYKGLIESRQVYVFSFILAAIIAFGKNLFYALILNPEGFGAIAFVILLSSFSIYFATPGILEGLFREVPILSGQGKDVRFLRSVGFTLVFIFSLMVGVILGGVTFCIFLFRPELGYLLWTAPLMFVTVIFNALMCDLQIRRFTNQYAHVLNLKSTFPLLITFVSSFSNASEILFAEFSGLVICNLICFFIWSRDLFWIPDFKRTGMRLIRLGIPFTLSSMCQNIVMNIDRWVIQFSLGAAALGSYTFIMTFSTFGLILVNMIQIYEVPRILCHYGATKNKQEVVDKAKRVLICTALFFGVVGIPVIKFLPGVLSVFYPQYVETDVIFIWVYIATAAIGMSFFDVLFRVQAQGHSLFFIQLGLMVITGVACVSAVYLNAPLILFAIIFSVVRVLNLVLGWSIGLNLMKYNINENRMLRSV